MATTVELNNGLKMPVVGLGTWQSPKDTVHQAVKAAVKAGYRHIDCALVYGNEAEVGQALKELFEEGVVKREDLWITTKLWNTFHSKEEAPKSLAMSLERLGLEYVDLYLMHWPVGFKEKDEMFPKNDQGEVLTSDVDFVETYKAMEEMLASGKVKSIGVSNFNTKQLDRILKECSVVPVVNQVECHPYFNQEALRSFCEKQKIKLTAYSPLGSPNSAFNPPDYPILLEDPKLIEIAKKHNKSVAQVAIRFQVQRGVIVIPKSVTPRRIIENFQVFDFELDPEDMASLMKLGERNYRFLILAHLAQHKYYPFGEV